MKIYSNYSREIELSKEENSHFQEVRKILYEILKIMRQNEEELYTESWDEFITYDTKKLDSLIYQLTLFSTIKLVKNREEENND